MPRPCKRRRVCGRPVCARFGPRGQERTPEEPFVSMTLDEYECIRLMDLEGLTQEQCAAQMEVARTTVQAVYQSARKKLALCLAKGLELRIGGGNYVLCQQTARCGRRHCQGMPENSEGKGEEQKKLGVTYENGEIFQHFGHTEQFKIYEVEDGKVVSSEVVDTNGSGHGALAGFLQERRVDALICGGIGGGAQNALAAAGIRLYAGCSGSADAAVEENIKNELEYHEDATCDHHGEHHHEGGCGDHGCGGHSCGDH